MVETPRRREIEAAASALFRERGYSGTSVRDIARALDIQGASLYAHVASKEDVLWSIVDRTARRFEEATSAALQAVVRPDDPAETLAALVRAHVMVVTEDVERASVFVHEWRSLTPERRLDISLRRDIYEGRFRAAIEAGVASGRFTAVDPTSASAFILTAMNGLVAWYRPDGRMSQAEIIEAYSALALGAVSDGEPATAAR
jgi:AcrR family transcriptional regulator